MYNYSLRANRWLCVITHCIFKSSSDILFLLERDYSFVFPFEGANVNAAKIHETALHHAAKVKNTNLIDLLVEFGGNVYARDNLNKKPIHYTSLGSPSYLCLEFYESKCVGMMSASCLRQCVRAPVKYNF